MGYSIDTSALIEAWRRNYPKENFPGLWSKLAELISTGELFAVDEVREELSKKDDELLAWVNDHDGFFVPLEQDIQKKCIDILSQDDNRRILTNDGRNAADAWVIALAEARDLTVVSEEKSSLRKPRIPNVCRKRRVRCITLLDLIREKNWKFSS